MDRLSEIHLRTEKVNKLKDKLLSRIKEKKRDLLTEIYPENEQNDYIIEQCFCLTKLEDFLKEEKTFMTYSAQYESSDLIVYDVLTENIEIWLMTDFDFVETFLCKAERNDWFIERMFNSKYFNFEFMSILEKIIYRDKLMKIKETLDETTRI